MMMMMMTTPAGALPEHWNRAFSRPVWTEEELRHKLRDAGHSGQRVAGAQVEVIQLPAIRNDLANLLADPRAHARSLQLLLAD